VESACQYVEDVDAHLIIEETQRNLFDGVPENEVQKALILSARTLIEKNLIILMLARVYYSTNYVKKHWSFCICRVT